MTRQNEIFRGRLLELRSGHALLHTEAGSKEIPVDRGNANRGDIVEIRDRVLKTLTSNRSGTMNGLARILDPRRIRGAEMRLKVEAGIREFFRERDFRETRTPLLAASPGMEPHIRPFRVQRHAAGAPSRWFLPTSPEFAMKRLLVGGLERIFQISPVFRDEPNSATHHPEFTMLEWYRAYAGYEDIMRDTEELFAFLGRRIFGKEELSYCGKRISVRPPWPRLRVRDLFQEAGIDLIAASTAERLRAECQRMGLSTSADDTWDDLYFRIWLNRIEPELPADQAVFVTRYPASQAALSVVDADPDGSRWAKRFEVYAGGLELGNAFEELTDPVEQRKRFLEDMALRREIYGEAFPASPLDEDFLGALSEGMPPSGGIAMGVDRLVMLFADEPEIDYTTWLPVRE